MVTKKPKGLGKGLEALLGPKVSELADGATAPSVLKLSQLRPGRYQPRTRMDEGSLYELAESIKSQGVMQPVLVRPVSRRPWKWWNPSWPTIRPWKAATKFWLKRWNTAWIQIIRRIT